MKPKVAKFFTTIIVFLLAMASIGTASAGFWNASLLFLMWAWFIEWTQGYPLKEEDKE
jgi:hypothetical protein